MRAAFLLGGGAPVIKRYMAGTTISAAGIPVLGSVDAGTDSASIEPMSATAAVGLGSQVGLALSNTGTIADTGMTVESDLFIEVVVNPNLVIGCRANSGTTSGTALTATATTSAQADGTVANGTTTFDNGWLYGTTGGNAGLFRRTEDAAGACAINFVNAIGNGDEFVAVQGFPCGVELGAFESFDLTTDLTEAVADVLSITNDSFAILDIITDQNAATTKTEYLLLANMHLFGSSSLV